MHFCGEVACFYDHNLRKETLKELYCSYHANIMLMIVCQTVMLVMVVLILGIYYFLVMVWFVNNKLKEVQHLLCV